MLTSIDGKSFKYFDEFEALASDYKGQTVSATVLRAGETLTKTLQIDANGNLGLIKGANYSTIEALGYFKVVETPIRLAKVLVLVLDRFTSQISSYWTQLKLIFSPSTGAYKGVGGFKAIFDIFRTLGAGNRFGESPLFYRLC